MMTDMLEGYVLDGMLPSEIDMDVPQLKAVHNVSTPQIVDLRPYCSPVENQAKIGSCVANAVVGALEYHQINSGAELRDLSRLFVYYNARKLGDRIGQSGTTSNRAVASVLGWGVCPAAMWPYQPATVDTAPTNDCYSAARRFTALQVAQVNWGQDCREALANGFPVIFGMATVRRDFGMAGITGEIRPPKDGNWLAPGGGHAMLMVGYDDTRNAWLVRNSWGEDYGEGGHIWIDYDYLPRYTEGRDGPLVIGDISESRAYSLDPVKQADLFQQVLSQSSVETQNELLSLRQSIGSELEANISKTRQSIRDRLRGPGAGGGY